MNTENLFAGYITASAGELRVVVRYDNGTRVVAFQKITQDVAERGPWFYTFDYLVNASRKGKGVLLEAAAPLWGYPEWSLTAAELARAVYSAVEGFRIVDTDALSAAMRGVR